MQMRRIAEVRRISFAFFAKRLTLHRTCVIILSQPGDTLFS